MYSSQGLQGDPYMDQDENDSFGVSWSIACLYVCMVHPHYLNPFGQERNIFVRIKKFG